ncbi:MAG: alanine racemase [Verrucomicrobiaceae bacterium]|nr:alanine racemase [Verrucomicrobiaceae bacterium]
MRQIFFTFDSLKILQKLLGIVNKFPHRSWIEVDFERLEANVRNIKASLPEGVKYVCVVKADAYGHCMPQALVRFLKGGADIFAVANLYEASRVREIVSDKPVLVLSPILRQERNLVFEYGATPAVSSYNEAKAFSEMARERGKVLGIHIKLDTGMGRVGIWHANADEVIMQIKKLPNVKITGIFSHLSSADSDIEYTKQQVEIFKSVVQKHADNDMLIHLHNSAGLRYISVEKPFNAVRMGLLQYGINPHDDCGGYENLNLKPVLAFKSRIISIAEADGRKIASVCAGYADGVPSGFTSEACVLVGGKRCQIVGNVSLDECIINIENAPDAEVGDEVVFIGEQGDGEISLADYSRWTRRIPWETMVAIPRRVDRILK